MALAVFGGAAQAADKSVGEKMDDAKITTEVKTKLAADKVKSLVNVSVETDNGIVRLTGKVPTVDDKAHAEKITRRVKGVHEVRNELKVEAASPAASPKQ
jgi:osmotically-inducible protein OsmY